MGVALDELGSGSLNLFASMRPGFVKPDIGLARGMGRDPYRAAISRKLVELTDEFGVAVIVEASRLRGAVALVRRSQRRIR